MKPLALRCPDCGGELRPDPALRLACDACERSFGSVRGLSDLRVGTVRADGWPAGAAALERALARLDQGTSWKAALEELLLELDDDAADRTMQILRESRGAWAPLCAARGGRALVLGNALSGTGVALARCGFEVTLYEPDPLRLSVALHRARALLPESTRALVGGDGRRLPFVDDAFELVVHEDGPPSAARGWGHDLDECRRVTRGEVVLVAQNRLAYKTSDLRRGRFQVPGPLEFVGRALRPRAGERTLGGYRRLVGAATRAYALYPHSDDFSHVVGLDDGGPRLTIGPKERRNRLKVAGERVGLFPLLAPSFLVVGAARDAGARLERVLDALAARIGEPRPALDQLVATRGQTAVALTAVPRAPEGEPAGRWCLHVPLCPAQVAQVERHMRTLRALRGRFPDVPVPEPLFLGEIEGLFLSCERRLGGLTAPQLTGDQAAAARLLADAARHLARLVVAPAAACDERRFEELVGRRFALVAHHARVETTLAELERLRTRSREVLLGRTFPLVVMHADLRSKHVQARPDGSVLGYLDWGTAAEPGLPYVDLLHLIVHERKQEAGLGVGEAWRLVRDRSDLREHERAALDGYARALGLDDDYRRLIEAIYPVFVAAMAEANWDYSRPRWLHRQFGL